MPRTPEQNREIREKTRQNILDVALKLFATKGYNGTSMADIAKAADISKGLAYNYFESKKHIAVAINDYLVEFGEFALSETLKVSDPYERLEVLTKNSLDHIKENEEYWRYYIRFAMQPDNEENNSRINKEFLNKMFEAIEGVFREIGAPNPEAEARIYGAILDGLGFHYYFDKENYPFDKMAATINERYGKEALQKQYGNK